MTFFAHTVPLSNWMVIPSAEYTAPSFQLCTQMGAGQSIHAREGWPISLTRLRSHPFWVINAGPPTPAHSVDKSVDF